MELERWRPESETYPLVGRVSGRAAFPRVALNAATAWEDGVHTARRDTVGMPWARGKKNGAPWGPRLARTVELAVVRGVVTLRRSQLSQGRARECSASEPRAELDKYLIESTLNRTF